MNNWRENYNTSNTPKIIGGITKNCTEMGKALYENIVTQMIPVTSTETAEMVKLLENTFRAINIGLANEMKLICDKLNIDVHNVIESMMLLRKPDIL